MIPLERNYVGHWVNELWIEISPESELVEIWKKKKKTIVKDNCFFVFFFSLYF